MRNIAYKRLLKLIQIYIFFTLGLFLFGPIVWVNDNNYLLIFFIVVYVIFLSMGYKKGMKRFLRKSTLPIFKTKNMIKVIKFIIVLSIIYSFLFIFRYGKTFSISEIINNTLQNILNPASQYAKTHQGAMESADLMGGGVLAMIVTFSGILTIPAIVLPVVYFKELTKFYKFLACFGIMLQVAGKTIIGTNEGIFDIGIIFISGIMIINARNLNKSRRKKRINFRLFFVIGIIIALLLSFFTNNINQRTGATFAFPTIGNNYYNLEATILKFIPKNLEATLAYLTVYLCEGYYGMALALKLWWVPTFGTGFSSFIRNNLQEAFGINLIQYSYQGRAEIFGWGANRNWHTAYTWFANDVSFLGVPIIMFLIGWLLIRTYRDSVENKNPFSCVLFGILLIQILFLSANNKIFASATTFIPFWLFLILWKITKR